MQLLQQKLRRSEIVFLIVGHHLLSVFALTVVVSSFARRQNRSVLSLLQSKLAREKLRRRILRLDLGEAHLERRIVRELRLDGRIVDALGVKLEIDILIDAHFLDSLDVARTRAVADPIQQVNDLLIGGEAGTRRFRFGVGNNRHHRAKR